MNCLFVIASKFCLLVIQVLFLLRLLLWKILKRLRVCWLDSLMVADLGFWSPSKSSI